MYLVSNPGDMNRTFAEAFNSRRLENMLALCEADSILMPDESDRSLRGLPEISTEWRKLLQLPGTLVSHNNFCVQHGELALLRADWHVIARDGSIMMTGSSAEIIRRQADGRWLYVIDHAMGASRARAF